MSPTPTAGLGGLGGLDGLAGLNLDPTGERPSQQPGSSQNDRDARDRIRNVWDTIRERMGFSSRNPGSAGQPGTLAIPEGQGTEGDGAAARMRPGELMLAEMARALNAGLGLAGRSDRQGSENPAPEAANSDEDTRPPAPEAGFERFLLNLQADLRAVLSEDVPAHNEDTSTQAQAANPEPLQPVTSVLESSAPPSPSDVPLQSAGLDSDFDDEDTISPVTERREGVSSRSRPPHPRTATPIPTPTIPHIVEPIDRDNQNTRATVDRRRPAVNLWRIYRFQPIPAPPSQNQAQAQSTSASPVTAESLLHGSSTVPPESLPGSTTTTMATGNNAGTDAMPPAAAVAPQPVADLNVVVPVIVVGLQSVDTALGRAQANGDEPTLPHDDLQEAAADAGIQEDIFAAQDPLNGNSHMPSTPRGRSWPSRAANALRTLRPGRRTGSRGRNSNEGPGSRTFLIYVIGGTFDVYAAMRVVVLMFFFRVLPTTPPYGDRC